MTGPIELTVTFWFRLPKSSERKREPVSASKHIKKPDASNVLKALEDALNGVAWEDDSQICNLHVYKRTAAQGQDPYTRIEVNPC